MAEFKRASTRRQFRRAWRSRWNAAAYVAATFFVAVLLIYLQMTGTRDDQDDFHVVENGGAESQGHRKEMSGSSRRWGRARASKHKPQLTPRAASVVAGMKHAWAGYSTYAMGADELLPLTRTGKATLGGLGASVVDAMSTLRLMGLHDEFARARSWVAANMTFDVDTDISFFEIVIRVLGGLISAHQLSGDEMLLEKAVDLGDRLLPAFSTSPTGIVDSAARLPVANTGSASGVSCLVEFGSDTLEFGSLTALTGDDKYREGAEKGIRFLHKKFPGKGLLTNNIERSSGSQSGGDYGIGPRGDSYYEYLLKYWLLGGREDDHWRARWEKSVDDVLERLVIQTGNESIAYAGEEHGGAKSHILPHLACWYPGNLALGLMMGAIRSQEKQRRVKELAVKMTNACASMYFNFPLGLAPDTVDIDPQAGSLSAHFSIYMQRPEVVESLFYMKRLTGEPQYEEWAWLIWQSIERHTRQEVGYSGLKDATVLPPVPDNIQNSWFLAETLKYLFLVFSPDESFNLEKWVLNTEAHPLRVVGGTGADV